LLDGLKVLKVVVVSAIQKLQVHLR